MKRSTFLTVVSLFLVTLAIPMVGCRPRAQAPPDVPVALPPPSTAQTAQMPAAETASSAVVPAEAPASPRPVSAAPPAPSAQPGVPSAAPAAPAQAPPPVKGVAGHANAPKPASPASQPASSAAAVPKPVKAATAPKASAPKPAEPPKTPEPAPVAPKPAKPAPAKPAASKPAPAKPTSAPAKPAVEAAATEVIGTIEVVSNVPDPSSVPYDTCVTFIKYKVSRVVGGSYDGGELLAVFWGMKDGKLQPAARFAEGQSHRLRIEPFSEQEDLARVMQADDTNEYSLTPYWVVSYAGG